MESSSQLVTGPIHRHELFAFKSPKATGVVVPNGRLAYGQWRFFVLISGASYLLVGRLHLALYRPFVGFGSRQIDQIVRRRRMLKVVMMAAVSGFSPCTVLASIPASRRIWGGEFRGAHADLMHTMSLLLRQ